MRVLVFSAIATVTAWMPVGVAAQQARPVFRATTSLVAVPVFVQDGNRPVPDLKAADFDLRDDGVPQVIESVADAATPIDLTIVIDTSVPDRELQQFVSDVTRLEAVLDPLDRVRVLTFAMHLAQQMPWSSPADLVKLTGLRAGGRGAHADALAASLIGPSTPERRHLVTFFTDGVENLSGVHLSRIVELAARTGAVLYTYALDLTRPLEHLGRMDRNGNVITRERSVFRPVRLTKSAVDRVNAIEQAARRTGGRPRDYRGSAFSSVRDLLEEFRRGYVLYFRPSDGTDGRWHELSVSVTTSDGEGYRVDARPGYTSSLSGSATPSAATVRRDATVFPDLGPHAPDRDRLNDEGPPGDAAIEGAGSSAGRATEEQVRTLLLAYERGEHAEATARLRGFAEPGDTAELVRVVGQRWIDEYDTGSTAYRRVVVAALALELSVPSFPIPIVETGPYRTWNDEVRPLIMWAKETLGNNLTVHPAERAWYLAAIASLHGMLAFRHDMRHRAEAEALLAQAITRVPDEVRHRWSDAQMVEQLWDARAATRRARPDEVRKAYDTVESRSGADLRAEMHVHLVSRFLNAHMDDEALGPITDEARRAAAQEALARTNYAEQLTSDPFVVYMARFFRARLYDRLDLRAPAETAYRSALDVYPHAQSASMPLATLVFLRGEEAGAQALVDTVLANPGAEDPWRVYFLQDYRRLPVYIEQMRAALTSSR